MGVHPIKTLRAKASGLDSDMGLVSDLFYGAGETYREFTPFDHGGAEDFMTANSAFDRSTRYFNALSGVLREFNRKYGAVQILFSSPIERTQKVTDDKKDLEGLAASMFVSPDNVRSFLYEYQKKRGTGWQVTANKTPDFIAYDNSGEIKIEHNGSLYIVKGPDLMKKDSLPYNMLREMIFKGHMGVGKIEEPNLY